MVDISNLAGIGLSGLENLKIEFLILILIAIIWKFVWYAIALYKTIERKQIVWFAVLFVAAFLLGDLGILAIIYLLVYKKPKAKTRKKK